MSCIFVVVNFYIGGLKTKGLLDEKELQENRNHAAAEIVDLMQPLKGMVKKAFENCVSETEKVLITLNGINGHGLAVTSSGIYLIKAGFWIMSNQKFKFFNYESIATCRVNIEDKIGKFKIFVNHKTENTDEIVDSIIDENRGLNEISIKIEQKSIFEKAAEFIHETLHNKLHKKSEPGSMAAIVDEIVRLNILKDNGTITKEQYLELKQKLYS